MFRFTCWYGKTFNAEVNAIFNRKTSKRIDRFYLHRIETLLWKTSYNVFIAQIHDDFLDYDIFIVFFSREEATAYMDNLRDMNKNQY